MRKEQPVLQYDLDGNFVAEHPSQKEAIRLVGMRSSSEISYAIRGERKTAGGYQWRKKEGDTIPSRISPVPSYKHPFSIPVCQYTKNGEFVAEYHSTREASRQTGIDISKAINGERKTAGGYVWKKKEEVAKQQLIEKYLHNNPSTLSSLQEYLQGGKNNTIQSFLSQHPEIQQELQEYIDENIKHFVSLPLS